MASRTRDRTEAELQSDLRLLLLLGDLQLEDDDLHVALEAQVGHQQRIDVEAGFTVFECKRDLRLGRTKQKAVEQLGGYLRARSEQTAQRYVGVLTDGADWYLYLLEGTGAVLQVSHLVVSATDPDVEALKVWIEGVLATRQHINPIPSEIERRLGAGTSAFALDRTTLASLYAQCRRQPEVQTKRMLWARLLTTAFGAAFKDDDDLFIEHTYLVVVAELIAHVIVGLDVREPTEATSAGNLLSGRYFSEVDIAGVVEPDFFDWVAQADGGEAFVRDLARRVSRFNWTGAEHDVLKVLYESVVSTDQRHSLGEYYTPDWLAERIVAEVVQDPLTDRVLDPACGSGTFLFYAVKRYLSAADASGMSNADAVAGVVRHVFGVDVHPVAVTLARVTYILAIGLNRLQDRGPINVPVNVGDSLQWGQEQNLLNERGLVVYTSDGTELFASELRWPTSVAVDAGRFDALVSEITARAVARSPGARPRLPITAILNHHRVTDAEDRSIIETTYGTLCSLYDQGRDHIWSYYVRNLARPYWLSQPENRPSVIVGNPPWLSYRYMTTEMKERFREDSQVRGIWAGAEVATSQDLSGYFLARCAQLYLQEGGRFGFVMPLAAISRPHFEGFRKGLYPAPSELTCLAFSTPWNISAVKPLVFPMPASVVFGHRAKVPQRMGEEALSWYGVLPSNGDVSWAIAADHLAHSEKVIARPAGTHRSPYGARFRQGAAIVPRTLVTVEEMPAGPLGVPHGRTRVRTLTSAQDKEPWKSLQPREGTVGW
jgi:SAM-dependent methyltransferase